MMSEHPERELPLSHLLDALERLVDRIAEADRYCGTSSSNHQLRLADHELLFGSLTDFTMGKQV